MRVLIADKMAPNVGPDLEARGCTLNIDASLGGETLLAAIEEHDPQAIVVRSTRVTGEHLLAGSSLALVIRAGAGVNTIDIDGASAKGVRVANCPGKNAIAVAELTLGHLLNADRRIADNVADLRAGQWKKKTFAKGARGLKGRTLGIIGMGAIGRAVAKRAQAFDMDIVAFDPMLTDADAANLGITRAETMQDVAAASYALTVHVGLNDHTRGMIDASVLGAIAPGGIFINTSRGAIVNESALADAIRDNGLRAGLDVFCNEPGQDGDWDCELAGFDGVYGTHHIGASTDEASEAVGSTVVHIIDTWLSNGTVPNCVNPETT